MRILGIETSCDETAASVVEDGVKILSNVVSSSLSLHAKTGGIIPETAAREQVRYIIPVVEEALKKGGEIDAIGVTYGPGLMGSLLVGIETAKALAYAWQKPLIPVNHLIGHIYANFLNNPNPPRFTAIVLIVSGGHTDLLLYKNHGDYEYLGGTRDDAAGEAFDKTARLLNLPYPGGPEIAKLAEKGNPNAIELPRPMIKEKNYDFSFSGLKTAVAHLIKLRGGSEKGIPSRRQNEMRMHDGKPSWQNPDLAASIQEAVVDVLVTKTIRAAKEFKVNEILLCGGVSANKRLREKMTASFDGQVFAPDPKLCTDNAAIIASAAFFNYKETPWQEVLPNPSLHF